MVKTASTVTVCSRREPVLVCRKCLKRVTGGSRIKRALKSAVKSLRDAQPGRRPRLVMTACFGICPKRAVVVASGTTLHRGEYILLADAGQVVDAVALLMPADRP
ncbi:MAG: (2Fe-2S) ferredoxin domain-containing protein [Bradyrhizobium sp.]|nr:(2Fe-2S) ferredoxin domain-containing protein [Bradyrhizobium sp.]MDP3692859.1 (2Fe-2S) ferredoxin domain-containing protein [Bradyrhizobium sp.]